MYCILSKMFDPDNMALFLIIYMVQFYVIIILSLTCLISSKDNRIK